MSKSGWRIWRYITALENAFKGRVAAKVAAPLSHTSFVQEELCFSGEIPAFFCVQGLVLIYMGNRNSKPRWGKWH